MKKCPNCGNLTDSKFCPECGTDLNSVPELSDESQKADDKEPEKKSDAVENKEITEQAKVVDNQSKNKKILIIIAGIVVIALVFFLGMGLGGSDSDSTSNESTTTEDSSSETSETEEEPEEETYDEETDSSSGFGTFTKAEDYSYFKYDSLARNPDKYDGNKYKGRGKVLQVLESDTEVDLRIATSDDGYDDVIYAVYDPSIVDSRILEDDYVGFYGQSKGLYSYESTGSGTITIPMMYIHKISVQ